MKKKKINKLTLLDSILATICIVISIEAITPTAASSNSQFFYWIVVFLLFFIPYSLISTELGSTFPSEFGMYAWVKKALGRKSGLRTTWFYWINFPIWMLSFAILFSDLFTVIFGPISTFWIIIIELLFIIICCYLGTKRTNKLDDLIDVGAIFKLIIFSGIIILGLVSLLKYGSNTSFALETFEPKFDFNNLSVIALLLFNFTGLEIITTYQKDMVSIKKQLPKTILYSCIIIITFYILPIISMKIAFGPGQLDPSTGLVDTYRILLENLGVNHLIVNIIVYIISAMIMYVLVAIIVSWTFGVNSVVRKACIDEKTNKFFTSINKDKVPDKLSLLNGLVAGGLCLFINLVPGIGDDLFMVVFSTCVIVYLASYLFLFAAFYKLRKIDNTPRVYKVPGNNLVIKLMTIIPTLILIIGLFFLLIPSNNLNELKEQWPIISMTLVIVILGEILIRKRK